VPSAPIYHSAALTADFAIAYVAGIAERSNDVISAANAAYFAERVPYYAERVAYHAAHVADPNVNAAHIATKEWLVYRLRELISWPEVKELIANYKGGIRA
jgi:hypothetical protein